MQKEQEEREKLENEGRGEIKSDEKKKENGRK